MRPVALTGNQIWISLARIYRITNINRYVKCAWNLVSLCIQETRCAAQNSRLMSATDFLCFFRNFVFFVTAFFFKRVENCHPNVHVKIKLLTTSVWVDEVQASNIKRPCSMLWWMTLSSYRFEWLTCKKTKSWTSRRHKRYATVPAFFRFCQTAGQYV